MKKHLWKSMRADLKSAHGNTKWKIGEWNKVEGELEMCNNGFHASEKILDSMNYVSMEILAKVEVRGKHSEQSDKQCWEEMRIVKAWKWEKKDSVALAVYASSLVLENFEKAYPNDKRPRQAIQAARRWLKHSTGKNRLAAESAARAARSAASSAAESAAKGAVASDKVLNKIEAWVKRRIKSSEEIK